jgi:protein TonB
VEHVADSRAARELDVRPTVRVLAALAVSVLCHATVLVMIRSWRLEGRASPPLVVTMVERGGGDGGRAGSAPSEAAVAAVPAPPAPAPAMPVAKPAVVPPPRPVAARAAARRAIPPAAPRLASAATAPHAPAVDAPLVETATTDSASAPGAGEAAAGGGAGDGDVGTGGAGAGRGTGAGNAVGNGSDGLRAFCARCPAPDYPGRARRQGWQGTVDVELAIARDGAVAEARIGHSSGYATLDDVALDVARRSRFTVPAGGDGLRGQLRYRFVLDETTARR